MPNKKKITKGVRNSDDSSSRKSGLPDPSDEDNTTFGLITAKKGNGGFIAEIIIPQKGEYKQVKKDLSQYHNIVNYEKSKLNAALRGGIRRGKGKFNNWVDIGSVVLLEIPGFAGRCKINGVYTPRDVKKYIRQGLIPRNYKSKNNEDYDCGMVIEEQYSDEEDDCEFDIDDI